MVWHRKHAAWMRERSIAAETIEMSSVFWLEDKDWNLLPMQFRNKMLFKSTYLDAFGKVLCVGEIRSLVFAVALHWFKSMFLFNSAMLSKNNTILFSNQVIVSTFSANTQRHCKRSRTPKACRLVSSSFSIRIASISNWWGKSVELWLRHRLRILGHHHSLISTRCSCIRSWRAGLDACWWSHMHTVYHVHNGKHIN